MSGEAIYECFVVGIQQGNGLRIYRDCHGKIREYKTPENAIGWAAGRGELEVLKLTVTRI